MNILRLLIQLIDEGFLIFMFNIDDVDFILRLSSCFHCCLATWYGETTFQEILPYTGQRK